MSEVGTSDKFWYSDSYIITTIGISEFCRKCPLNNNYGTK
jgi:hypothetical protein